VVAIELPLDIYDHFVGCCDPESAETSILKSGTIVRRPKGNHYERIAEISCQPDEAETLLATATKVCPNAVPSVQSLSAFSTGQTFTPKRNTLGRISAKLVWSTIVGLLKAH
jgi:hypothetical protein